MLLRLYNIDSLPVNMSQRLQPATDSPNTPLETPAPEAAKTSAGAALAETEEGALQEENEVMGQDQQDQTDSRETWTKAGDEEDRFNTTV